MKRDEIRQLFLLFEAAASELEGVECWSARELQGLLGYTKWENFIKVIQKAKDACYLIAQNGDSRKEEVRTLI